MGILKDHKFWIGFVVGYLFLVVFPQFSVRVMGVKGSVGRS